MKKTAFLLLIACTLFFGCAPANITAVKWDAGINGNNTETRCERVDMRDVNEMAKAFPKYDGWKLIYLSEYTTPNKVGTDAAVCFQRSK